MSDKSDTSQQKTASSPGKPWLIIALVAVIAAGAAGAGAWFFASRNSAAGPAHAAPPPSKTPEPAQYFALEPAFVVNLFESDGNARYLQLEVQLMTRDAEAFKAIELHAPALRANLLMLFAQQNSTDLATREGKQKLQALALKEVQKIMQEETGKPGIEQLLFTSFVMQ